MLLTLTLTLCSVTSGKQYIQGLSTQLIHAFKLGYQHYFGKQKAIKSHGRL